MDSPLCHRHKSRPGQCQRGRGTHRLRGQNPMATEGSPTASSSIPVWAGPHLDLQKNMIKQSLLQLFCSCSCAAVSINTLDVSCDSLKTRLFFRLWFFFSLFFFLKQVFLLRHAENNLLWLLLRPSRHKSTQVNTKPKELSPNTQAHTSQKSVLLTLIWTKQVFDDAHHVSYFKGSDKRTNCSFFWKTTLIQRNTAERKRPGSLQKTFLLSVAKVGVGKPAKPPSCYFGKASIRV